MIPLYKTTVVLTDKQRSVFEQVMDEFDVDFDNLPQDEKDTLEKFYSELVIPPNEGIFFSVALPKSWVDPDKRTPEEKKLALEASEKLWAEARVKHAARVANGEAELNFKSEAFKGL